MWWKVFDKWVCMTAGETEARNGCMQSADPGRGPGCSEPCAVATSPTAPLATAPPHRERPEGPPVCAGNGPPQGQGHGLWKVTNSTTRHCGTVTAGLSPARVPDGSGSRGPGPPRPFGRLLGWESSSGDGGSSKSRDEQLRGPGVWSGGRPVPWLSQHRLGWAGGTDPRAGLRHRGALGWAGRPERGSVPGVSSSSSWACRWE